MVWTHMISIRLHCKFSIKKLVYLIIVKLNYHLTIIILKLFRGCPLNVFRDHVTTKRRKESSRPLAAATYVRYASYIV